MFALEIRFKDGTAQSEIFLVRRPAALIGTSEAAHVVVDDMAGMDYELLISKQSGRRFVVHPIQNTPESVVPELLGGTFVGSTVLDIGPAELHVTSLDSDLMLRKGEAPDRAGVRVLRQACAVESPEFPAILVRDEQPIVVSFTPDTPVYVGRSNECLVRLSHTDVSAKHARIGFESGEFWIEDLGSTNGTYVNGQQISGRLSVQPKVPIVIGRQTTLIGVTSEDEVFQSTQLSSQLIQKPSPRRYPVIVTLAEVARPARIVLPIGGAVNVGRDPGSDMWLGAPHISRRHCEFQLSHTGEVSVRDFSTNGTAYDQGVLKKGHVLELNERPMVFDFGGEITIGVCFNEKQEEHFRTLNGASESFLSSTGNLDFVSPVTQDPLDGGTFIGNIDRLEAAITDTFSGKSGLGIGALRRLYQSMTPQGRVLFAGAFLSAVTILVFVILLVWNVVVGG